MKNKTTEFFKIVLLLVCVVTIFSCKSKTDNSPQSRQQSIKDYEDKIKKDCVLIDKSKADTLIKMMDAYVKDYPKDSMSETYIFQMAEVYANINDCKRSIECLDRIIREYPDGQKVGAAYFFKGVFYQDVCSSREKSVQAFEEYIKRYPDNPHVKDAQRLIETDTMENAQKVLETISQ